MLNNDTLIIIPAFNEGNTILKIVDSLKKKYNYLVINDGSFDMSDQILIDNKINHITNKKNLGLSKTMRIGMAWALENEYRFCMQFDGDGQHDIGTVEKMISARKDFNLILASRFLNPNKTIRYPRNKEVAWKVLRFMLKAKCGKIITDPTCGFRLFNKDFMSLYVRNERLNVEPSTLCWAIRKKSMSIHEVCTTIHNRDNGSSKFDKTFHQFYYLVTEIFKIIFWS